MARHADTFIQVAAEATVGTFLGEIFGYNPMAFRGGLSPAEYGQLMAASSYEKGAWMLGVGEGNAKGIDAIDLTHGKGVSLKTASNAENVRKNAELGVEQVMKAGYYDVNLYIQAKTVHKKELNDARIRSLLNDRVTRIVVFTSDGPIEYVGDQK